MKKKIHKFLNQTNSVMSKKKLLLISLTLIFIQLATGQTHTPVNITDDGIDDNTPVSGFIPVFNSSSTVTNSVIYEDDGMRALAPPTLKQVWQFTVTATKALHIPSLRLPIT